nr:reverse transcriptase domain-containing protein [Tanacetum cinerariifolium]
MKKRPQTEAQGRRNMMMYLKNTAGFRMDYFKGMSYDDIRPIFEAKFNSNIEFLLKTKEKIEEEENRVIAIINETPAQKAAKRKRLNEETKDVEELKQHFEIVPDEDDDVYTEATLLARKVPVVDYQIVHFNNKPHYKIIRADETHQLYVSFITLLKNFDREDLESLWSIVKERFSTANPNNFSDDFLLTTLKAMFGRPDGQDQVWMNQRSVHGQAKIPTLEVYIRSDAEYSMAKSGRADFGVDAAMEIKEKHQVFIAASEDISAARQKLMLLVTAIKYLPLSPFSFCGHHSVTTTSHTTPATINVIIPITTPTDTPLLSPPLCLLHSTLVTTATNHAPPSSTSPPVSSPPPHTAAQSPKRGVTERMIFNIDSAMKHSYSNDDTCFSIDVIDEILEEDFDALLDEGSKILHSIEGTLLQEEIFAEFDEFMAMTADENSDSESDTEEPTFKKITINTKYKIKTSLEEPPMDLKLKPFPDNLEYVFLEERSFLPVIISSQLSKENKNKLVSFLKKHKQAFALKKTDIPSIFPSFCKHKIQLLDDKKPVIQKQRRLNPNMQEVVKKEIVKLLDTGIIYPIVDSPWVSPIHCVPKKGVITVVTNENDELVPTRTVTG